MEVVIAATIAPVSSNTLSCSVIAERITASCHSNGMPSERTQSRQYAAVSSKKRRPTSATAPCTVSSGPSSRVTRSEEHTSELQSRRDLVCRLLLEKKKKKKKKNKKKK